MNNQNDQTIGDDTLWGLRAIAEFIGCSLRRTTWLAESGKLPTGQCGKFVIASKAVLRERFARMTRSARLHAPCS